MIKIQMVQQGRLDYMGLDIDMGFIVSFKWSGK